MEVEIQGPGGGCGCAGCLSTLTGLAFTAGILVFVFGMLKWSTAQSDEAAVDALNACKAATDLLGAPIRETRFSVGCGESESGGGSGHARWTMSVAGPKNSGTVRYEASYLGSSPWRIDRLELDVDGRMVTAVPCESGAEAPDEPGREREGKAGKREERDGRDGEGRDGGDRDGGDRDGSDRDGKAKHKAKGP